MNGNVPHDDGSLIPYDRFVQDALRQTVGAILRSVVAKGLPGEHHFYIAFKTRYPGVQIPKVLQERYPDEMTIVLQHRFWDLVVHDDHFEVSLSFNQTPSHLVVPFKALVGFVDPAVNFGLQFVVDPVETAVDVRALSPGLPPEVASLSAAKKSKRTRLRTVGEETKSKGADAFPSDTLSVPIPVVSGFEDEASSSPSAASIADIPLPTAAAVAAAVAVEGGNVVTIDRFRKK